MKILTKEEEAAHYNDVLMGGTVGGVLGLGLGLAGTMASARRWPSFQGLTLPFKAFLITSSGTFGAIINADRWSMAHQRARDPMRTYKNESVLQRELAIASMTPQQRFMEWGKDHRYSIVFASWVASMGIALTIVGRAKYMTTSQKVVQARVYAQGLTLAVLIVSAAFEVNDAKQGHGRWETVMIVDPDDPEHKHLIEKRIHREEYEGQDLWKDMVATEEKRLAQRKVQREEQEAAAKKVGSNGKGAL